MGKVELELDVLCQCELFGQNTTKIIHEKDFRAYTLGE